jgi:hypothetical protein
VRGGYRVPAGVLGLCHPQAAEQERALRLMQRPGIVPETVDKAVGPELVAHRRDSGLAAGIVQPDPAADDRQQQGGIHPLVVRRPLPAAGRVRAVGQAGRDRVGQRAPAGRLLLPVPAARHRSGAHVPGRPGDRAQPGHAGEPGVRPAPAVKFPVRGFPPGKPGRGTARSCWIGSPSTV